MNIKQVFGVTGGFMMVYILITLTNKPQVNPHEPRRPRGEATAPGQAQAPSQAAVPGREAPLGFCLPGVGAETLASADTDALLTQLKDTASWVAISPALIQDNVFASAVAADPAQTPSQTSLTHAIQKAHELGLQVLLRPVVVAKDGSRRERFVPSDPSAWFKSYAEALSPWIDLAEREHVETLCLGANYAQTEQDQPWGELIKQVRERYHGKLTYGAGLQPESGRGGYGQVSFWNDLDFVGLELPTPADVQSAGDESAMASAWDSYGKAIGEWVSAGQNGRQVIFTSVGYGSSTTDPGSAYRAFRQSIGSQPWVAAANWYQYDAKLDAAPAASLQAPQGAVVRPGGPPIDMRPGMDNSPIPGMAPGGPNSANTDQ